MMFIYERDNLFTLRLFTFIYYDSESDHACLILFVYLFVYDERW
jgi:hypothetical protein